MLARLHVIISSEKDSDYQSIKQQLLNINPNFSISPSHEYAGLKKHSEFYITCELEQQQVKPLLDRLNNDWDGDIDDCICYGFNTQMFNELVYALEFQYFI